MALRIPYRAVRCDWTSICMSNTQIDVFIAANAWKSVLVTTAMPGKHFDAAVMRRASVRTIVLVSSVLSLLLLVR